MSSEYSIHLWDKSIKGEVAPLDGLFCNVVNIVLDDENKEPGNRERITLFLRDYRLVEVARLFREIADGLHQAVEAIPTEDAAEAVSPPHRWG